MKLLQMTRTSIDGSPLFNTRTTEESVEIIADYDRDANTASLDVK